MSQNMPFTPVFISGAITGVTLAIKLTNNEKKTAVTLNLNESTKINTAIGSDVTARYEKIVRQSARAVFHAVKWGWDYRPVLEMSFLILQFDGRQ